MTSHIWRLVDQSVLLGTGEPTRAEPHTIILDLTRVPRLTQSTSHKPHTHLEQPHTSFLGKVKDQYEVLRSIAALGHVT